jgi:hypothetical protein
MNKPFQYNEPVFVKARFKASGRWWEKGVHWPWLEMSVDPRRAEILYNNGFIQHNTELLREYKSVGDGLDELGIEELHALVEKINEAVVKGTKNKTEAKKKRCSKSAIPDKQRGHIRRWRNLFGELENS